MELYNQNKDFFDKIFDHFFIYEKNIDENQLNNLLKILYKEKITISELKEFIKIVENEELTNFKVDGKKLNTYLNILEEINNYDLISKILNINPSYLSPLDIEIPIANYDISNNIFDKIKKYSTYINFEENNEITTNEAIVMVYEKIKNINIDKQLLSLYNSVCLLLKSNVIIKSIYKTIPIYEIQLKDIILSHYGFDRANIINYNKIPANLIKNSIYGDEFTFNNILYFEKKHIPIEIIDTMSTIFQYENGIIKLKRFTYYDYKYLKIIAKDSYRAQILLHLIKTFISNKECYDYAIKIGWLINIEFDNILDIKYVTYNELPEKYIYNFIKIVKDVENKFLCFWIDFKYNINYNKFNTIIALASVIFAISGVISMVHDFF